MTKEEIVVACQVLDIAELAFVRKHLQDMSLMRLHEAEAHRQAACEHLRAKEGEYVHGLVTWHCPDCGASRQISHHRERGGK